MVFLCVMMMLWVWCDGVSKVVRLLLLMFLVSVMSILCLIFVLSCMLKFMISCC